MKKLFLSIFILCFVHTQRAQILLNGDFFLGTTFWGCGAETNAETTYGGSSIFNSVAEVDALAGLCQTVSGLTVGRVYALTFDASRRTGSCPGPTVTNVDITISGGVLVATVTRTNTTFGYTTSGFLFTATATSHNITFAGGSGFGGSSCGMAIDNIAVITSALPIEMLRFDGTAKKQGIELSWSTISERNNARFDVERSDDGLTFKTIKSIPSAAINGNSNKRLDYVSTDMKPAGILNYYRIKQIDTDGTLSYSKIIAVAFDHKQDLQVSLYPNPNNGAFEIVLSNAAKDTHANVMLVGPLGKVLYSHVYVIDDTNGTIKIDLRNNMNAGIYQCVVSTETESKHFPLAIE